MAEKKLILITNDDGLGAKGIKSLIEAMSALGDIVVVAPSGPQSGMSQAITVHQPLRIHKVQLNGTLAYAINGTPTDCVKIALNRLVPRKPDLLVSGINHGSNSSASVLYSGTMGAALEGCINGFPSIGFSLISFDPQANFDMAIEYAQKIAAKVLEEGLPENTCLNVNFPSILSSELKGVKICRQTRGHWQEEIDMRTDPIGHEYFWLSGKFFNMEPNAVDTDEWALSNNYIAIVPTKVDLTCYTALEQIKNWKF